jgi:hypothetical protein
MRDLLDRLAITLRHAGWLLRNAMQRARGWKQFILRAARVGFLSTLSAVVIRADGTQQAYGVLGHRVVTTIGAAFIVDTLQNLVEPENLNWHQSGTGSASESTADTGLGLAVGSRVLGTQSEPAATTYRTVATLTYAASLSITEHGLFWANAGANTLFDRTRFAGMPVNSGDSIQFTYDLTVSAGG